MAGAGLRVLRRGPAGGGARLLELEWRSSKAVAASPLVHYPLAFLERSRGAPPRPPPRRIPPRPKLVFPYHWEMEAVLRAADPLRRAAPHYYLGLLLYSQDRREEALAEWEQAAETGWPTPPPSSATSGWPAAR